MEEYKFSKKHYKRTIRRKRLEHEVADFERKVQPSSTILWIMLPKREKASVPHVGLTEFEAYYGTLFKKDRKEGTTEPVVIPQADAAETAQSANIERRGYRRTEQNETGKGSLPGHHRSGRPQRQRRTPPVTRLFSRSLYDGGTPNRRRTTYVKLLFKGEASADDPANYRCISLAPHQSWA